MIIIFLFTRDNWRHRHNLSERELAVLVYPIDTERDFHLFVLYLLCTPPIRSTVIINKLVVEMFS
jgi:hypothetical protein